MSDLLPQLIVLALGKPGVARFRGESVSKCARPEHRATQTPRIREFAGL